MGLDVYLKDSKTGEAVDEKSERHPEHLFGKGYLRSSYNDSGINRVLRDLIDTDLWDLFGVTREMANASWEGEDEDSPPHGLIRGCDFSAAKSRVLAATAQLAVMQAEGGGVAVSTISAAPIIPKGEKPLNVDSQGAVELFQEEKRRSDGMSGSFRSYSNWKGHFFLDKPLEVVAAIPGKSWIGGPSIHFVYKLDLTWYIQALEVTVEFCDKALSMDDPGMVWSY